MIVDKPDSHFVFIFSKKYVYGQKPYLVYQGKPLTNKEYLEHWGKWIVLDSNEKIYELARKLDPYVEKEQIPCIKFDREPIRAFENLLLRECVMVVYCDDRQKEEVWQILAHEGVKTKAWKYERETMAMWLPGARLLEAWISSRGLTGEAAERVREDARRYFESLFQDENAVFTGIIQ